MSQRIQSQRPPGAASIAAGPSLARPARPFAAPTAIAGASPLTLEERRERAGRLGHRLARVGIGSAGAEPPPAAGRPLPESVRRRMEDALGDDLSAVRIHVGPQAAALGALAYTRGHDVHFAPDRYDPQSHEGRRLLGHELAHVVQQRAGRVAAPPGEGVPINADPRLEAEADALGARAARGAAAGPGLASARAHAPAPYRPIQAKLIWPGFSEELRRQLGGEDDPPAHAPAPAPAHVPAALPPPLALPPVAAHVPAMPVPPEEHAAAARDVEAPPLLPHVQAEPAPLPEEPRASVPLPAPRLPALLPEEPAPLPMLGAPPPAHAATSPLALPGSSLEPAPEPLVARPPEPERRLPISDAPAPLPLISSAAARPRDASPEPSPSPPPRSALGHSLASAAAAAEPERDASPPPLLPRVAFAPASASNERSGLLASGRGLGYGSTAPPRVAPLPALLPPALALPGLPAPAPGGAAAQPVTGEHALNFVTANTPGPLTGASGFTGAASSLLNPPSQNVPASFTSSSYVRGVQPAATAASYAGLGANVFTGGADLLAIGADARSMHQKGGWSRFWRGLRGNFSRRRNEDSVAAESRSEAKRLLVNTTTNLADAGLNQGPAAASAIMGNAAPAVLGPLAAGAGLGINTVVAGRSLWRAGRAQAHASGVDREIAAGGLGGLHGAAVHHSEQMKKRRNRNLIGALGATAGAVGGGLLLGGLLGAAALTPIGWGLAAAGGLVAAGLGIHKLWRWHKKRKAGQLGRDRDTHARSLHTAATTPGHADQAAAHRILRSRGIDPGQVQGAEGLDFLKRKAEGW